jgi:hypothetical protein
MCLVAGSLYTNGELVLWPRDPLVCTKGQHLSPAEMFEVRPASQSTHTEGCARKLCANWDLKWLPRVV